VSLVAECLCLVVCDVCSVEWSAFAVELFPLFCGA